MAYEIDNKTKVIYADVFALNAQEEKEVSKLMKFGYTVEHKPTAPKKKSLTAKVIQELLKDDTDGLTTFEKLAEENFMKAKIWFMANYPKDFDGVKTEVLGVYPTFSTMYSKYKKSHKKQVEKYQKYKADPANNKEVEKPADEMSEEAYTRYIYWTKVWPDQK